MIAKSTRAIAYASSVSLRCPNIWTLTLQHKMNECKWEVCLEIRVAVLCISSFGLWVWFEAYLGRSG
jgi:hypothetical protein